MPSDRGGNFLQNGLINYHQKILTLSHFLITLYARGDIVSPGRHCLTWETLSHPADSLSGRADNVWPGRQCLTWHTASLASHTQPAGRLPDPAHNLSDPANTRQIVRCLRMLTHARSYLNPLSGIPEGSIDSIDRGSLRGDPLWLDRSIDRLDRKSIGDPLGLDRLDRLDRSGIP